MVLYYFGGRRRGNNVAQFIFRCPGSLCLRDSPFHGGCCVCAKSCVEFGDERYECGGLAEPDAGDSADGGDWNDFLGGFAVSGADEEVSRGNGRHREGRADIRLGVCGGPDDAAAGESVADHGELAGREPDWDDVFVFVWAGGADVFGDGAAAENEIEIFEFVFWSSSGNADGGVYQLRGADCARILCGGNEQGVGADGDVCFAGVECGGAGDDVCVVSGEGDGVEAGDGDVFDFCVCTGGGFTGGRERVYLPDRDSGGGELVAGAGERGAVVWEKFLVRVSGGVSADDSWSGVGSAGD